MAGVSEHDLLLPNNTSPTTPCDNEFEELMMKSTLPNMVNDYFIYLWYITVLLVLPSVAVIVASCQFLSIIQNSHI